MDGHTEEPFQRHLCQTFKGCTFPRSQTELRLGLKALRTRGPCLSFEIRVVTPLLSLGGWRGPSTFYGVCNATICDQYSHRAGDMDTYRGSGG
jgi:hypothetical protein